MRVRIDSVNAFAEFLGEPARLDRQPPARGYQLTPGDTEALLHDLTVKRPIHANAMTALRTAAWPRSSPIRAAASLSWRP